MGIALLQRRQGDEFASWWRKDGEWVEEPNQRRDGLSGVIRHRARDGVLLYIKRQDGHTFRSLRYPLGRPTTLRECQALQALESAGVHVPHVRYFGMQREGHWQAVMATEALPEGFISLEDLYQQTEPLTEPVRVAVLGALAKMLARMHQARWQHAGLYDKHLFVRISGDASSPQVDAATLDLERARHRLTASQAARHDLRQLKRRIAQWNDADWAIFLPAYEKAFGRAVVF